MRIRLNKPLSQQIGITNTTINIIKPVCHPSLVIFLPCELKSICKKQIKNTGNEKKSKGNEMVF